MFLNGEVDRFYLNGDLFLVDEWPLLRNKSTAKSSVVCVVRCLTLVRVTHGPDPGSVDHTCLPPIYTLEVAG